MVRDEAAIRNDLVSRLAEVKDRARSAGPLLARIIGAHSA